MDAIQLLNQLIRRTGLEPCHIQTLKRLESVMTPMAPEISLAFYDYLGRDTEMHAILWAVPGRVEHLYERFANWYREVFSGDYGPDYALRRQRIGLVHASVGVKPSYIMPAMGIVQELSLEHLRNSLRGPEIFSAVEAFEKMMAIESGLMQESYMVAMARGYNLGYASDSQEALVVGAREMLKSR